jgi:hypothetical protein
MFYSSTYKNWETVQWLTCHYDLFSQIVYVKIGMSKPTFFCLNKEFIWIVLRACKLVWIQFLLKLVHIICIILLPVNWHCELTEVVSVSSIRLYGWLWLVYVILLMTSTLLGSEHGITEFSLQRWLYECATVLCHKCLVCLPVYF